MSKFLSKVFAQKMKAQVEANRKQRIINVECLTKIPQHAKDYTIVEINRECDAKLVSIDNLTIEEEKEKCINQKLMNI